HKKPTNAQRLVAASKVREARKFALPIMVVDDEPSMLEATVKQLKRAGFTNVQAFEKPQKALDYYKTALIRPQLVITDLSMPEMMGNQLINAIAAQNDAPPAFIIHSSDVPPDLRQEDNAVAQTMRQHGAVFVTKLHADFTATAISIAETIVTGTRRLEPVIVGMVTPAEIEALKKQFAANPCFKFMLVLTHKINNTLTVKTWLGMISYDLETGVIPETESIIELFKSFKALFETIDYLTFMLEGTEDEKIPANDRDGFNAFLDKIADKGTSGGIQWKTYSFEQKALYRQVIQAYFDNGFKKFADTARLIYQALQSEYDSSGSIAAETIKMVNTEFKPVDQQLSALHNASRFAGTPNMEMVYHFMALYRRLATAV
ncbi:MAG: response regulator, partial [Candidatus Margulisiibacteriota bacterium]